LALTQVSHCRYGARTAGSIPTIPVDGSSGIVATTWVVECLKKMLDKSNGGRRFAAMLLKLSDTASQVI
jgi:hypothetical protein